ncbi:unnamed protein product, partial [Trichogramma brassicae]
MSDLVTAAKVRFVQDKHIAVIPVDEIMEFRVKKPSNKFNFNPRKLYKGLWTDEKNPNGVILPIQINELASTTKSNLKQLSLLERDVPHFSMRDPIADLHDGSGDNPPINPRKRSRRLSSDLESDHDTPASVRNDKQDVIVIQEELELRQNELQALVEEVSNEQIPYAARERFALYRLRNPTSLTREVLGRAVCYASRQISCS